MAWESRGSSRYYYRKRRVGDTVVSEYVGSGPVAEMVATLDQLERERASEARRKWQKKVEAERTLDRQIDTLGSFVRGLRNAVLLANGYHTHKGQWRQRRDPGD